MPLKMKSLQKQAEDNVSVKTKTKNIKEGVPLDHSSRHHAETPSVGVNIGVTLNMEDYNSLRVDVWLSDTVKEGETLEKAHDRITKIASAKLQEVVAIYREE